MRFIINVKLYCWWWKRTSRQKRNVNVMYAFKNLSLLLNLSMKILTISVSQLPHRVAIKMPLDHFRLKISLICWKFDLRTVPNSKIFENFIVSLIQITRSPKLSHNVTVPFETKRVRNFYWRFSPNSTSHTCAICPLLLLYYHSLKKIATV